MDPRIAVVVITRDRPHELQRTLTRLRALPEAPEIVVVDNGSARPGASAVAAAGSPVRVIALPENLGARARNIGVAAVRTPYVAFADDDSWWAPGALARAADALDADPRLALVNGRILVGDEQREDPNCAAMARSPLPRAPGQQGHALLSFIACGAVVRRRASRGLRPGGRRAPPPSGGSRRGRSWCGTWT